ncbi:MAG: molybdopterin molybdotransferase MoeA [Elusimicrobia bacterium]|nr:molybdopterin molybdotransferase MoeA [Elusimicrobiota bacterium]
MISYGTAIKSVLENTRELGSEKINVPDSLGRYIAKDVYSGVALPSVNNSAMDGFAVRAKDTLSAGRSKPVILKIIGEIKAGDGKSKIKGITPRSGECVEIFTGATIPAGADAVIPIEDVESSSARSTPARIKIFRPAKRGQHIRYRGENVSKGERVLLRGHLIRPQEIGLLAQMGISRVDVFCRPRVAVLATGNELVSANTGRIPRRIPDGKIIDTNSWTLYNSVVCAGGIPILLGIAKDIKSEIRKKILAAMEPALKPAGNIRTGKPPVNILLVSAGVSVGEHDYVKDVLKETGIIQKFWKVRQRPGQPLFFGVCRGVLVFGLPGNTVSTLLCFEQYVRPAMLKMQGSKKILPRLVVATSEEKIDVQPGKTNFLRGMYTLRDGKYFVRLTGGQGSGILKSMVNSNCLIVLPERTAVVRPGGKVLIQPT